MLELLFCSLFTIFPDYLFRRYVQGKRIGQEITIYSVWYELRYGIVTCAMLTISLVTMIFYFHPATTSATLFFRTVPILPESGGRVVEVMMPPGLETHVKAGDVIFRLDSSEEEAAVISAERQVSEIDAEIALATGELLVANAQIGQAEASLKQAVDELNTKVDLQQRNSDVVTRREVEKLQTAVDARQSVVDAAVAQQKLTETKINVALPASRQTALAKLDQARADLAKKTVYAGVDGTVTQFSIRKGDIVSPLMRPGGILIPDDAGRKRMFAGFNQIESQVIKPGMAGEITCPSLPFTIIPVVVTGVQFYLASGQFSASERLVDTANPSMTAGSITTMLEPVYEGGFDRLPPGSRCIANLYTDNHERLESDKDMGLGTFVFLHVVDTVGLVHAILLRSQSLLLPIRTLVLSGSH
ncbi:HlyD family secretion protein [Roseibium litorale]|uniref:HlyD family secretion protein n=1 Tax=Roseibium litorale TaxID=2803841 RepID=A0ABR9CRH9_9HYPH|nr:HlyD family secretion protein [Roseibium litorale]MBD8893435.1 HlyD family secretion protein [Roseibium litorale]